MAGDTLSRDVALNVIGKIEGYQKELEKVPGVTAKAATRAALQMQRHFTKDLVDQFKKAEKEAAKSASAWEQIFGAVGETITTDLVKGIASSMAGAKSEIAALTGEINTYAQATGLSAESVNAMRFAMESQGRTFDELGSALENFPERMEQFRQGGGEAAGVMEVLGFKTKDADKLIADMGGTFEKVIARMQGIKNEGHRAALMTSMFGDSALYLSTALGDVPLDEWKDRAQIGVDVSQQAIAANADWTATLNILGEAFTRTKQDATNIVDLANMAKDVGQAFVVMSSVAVDGIDTTMKQASRFVTWMRAVWRGEFESAQQVENEFWETADRGWSGIITDAIEVGKEFRSVADSIGNMAAESSNANTKLGKTTQEMDKAKAAAKQLAAELDRTRSLQFQWYKAYQDITSDTASEETKLWREKLARDREVFQLSREGALSYGELQKYKAASDERYHRDWKKLNEEQAKEAHDLAREGNQLAKDKYDEAIEFEKEYRAQLTEIAFEFANVASETVGGVFDLMAQARAKDIAQAEKAKDKEKERLDELLEFQKDAVTKEQLYRINARIENTRARIADDREAVRDAKKAARDVAMMQKGQALFQIGLNTAQAVMMAWGTVPPPLNVAAAIAAGAAGATQLAIAAAQPLPKFHMGTARVPGVVPEDAGEARLNARASAALGPQIIDAINAGLNPLSALAGRFGAPAMAGGGDVYLDGYKVGRALAASSRRPSGYRSPYGRN